MSNKLKTILIANRGEIACRIIRTARVMGIKSIAVYSEADVNALHVDMASDAVEIGSAVPTESYLNIEAIIEAVHSTGADAVHPGYGFLSENTTFVERLEEENITFIGPGPEAISKMGDKIESRKLANSLGVPTVPGNSKPIQNLTMANSIATEIGYPVMLKASAGGGGKGIRIVFEKSDLKEALEVCSSEAKANFGDDRIFLEKYISNPRHIEIQILADKFGNVVHLGERECSIQRRHQKVMEEAPSPFLTDQMREEMGKNAIKLAKSVNYYSAGTVEFIVDEERNFFFLEMNTRLQVEHPVTELVTGVDLVEQMIKIAAGNKLEFDQKKVKMSGWALESRVYAENPETGFLPSVGRLIRYREPTTSAFGTKKNVRVDGGVNEGDEINRHYDPMIAKLITNGKNRDEAIKHMRWAIDEYYVRGIANNLGFLAAVMANPRFQAGELSTNFIDEEFGAKFIPEKTKHEDIELIAIIVGAVNFMLAEKRTHVNASKIDGQICSRDVMPIKNEWVIEIGVRKFSIEARRSEKGIDVIVGKRKCCVETDWRPSYPIFAGRVNNNPISMQVEYNNGVYKIQHFGLVAEVKVMSPLAAEMLSRLPKKSVSEQTNKFFSPMPGLLLSIDVEEGQHVTQGETLATVEAMKMENKIVSEKNGVVSKIYLEIGESIEAGQLILELK